MTIRKWMRRIRGTFGMGLIWAAGGALVGGLIELIWNIWPGFPIGPLVDMWPQTLAIPGFLGGVVFSGVLGIAGRHRRFDELSLPRFAAWGAVGGLLASLVPAALVALGLASTSVPVWRITAALVGPFALGSAIAAAGSLALARGTDGARSSEAPGGMAGRPGIALRDAPAAMPQTEGTEQEADPS